MTIIDRPIARRRATQTASPVDFAARTPLGGHYVSGPVGQGSVEGSYVSAGSPVTPMTRGTYVTTPSHPVHSGGSYTYVG